MDNETDTTILSKIDASSFKTAKPTAEIFHLITNVLAMTLEDDAKSIDLDVPTLLAKQKKSQHLHCLVPSICISISSSTPFLQSEHLYDSAIKTTARSTEKTWLARLSSAPF